MTDLCLLYYTANRLSSHFAGAVRRALVSVTDQPIIVVSQSGSPHQEVEISADFANRIEQFINVGQIQPSIVQVYRNVLLAAQAATTRYVAFCEDDGLYTREHFSYRPADDVFAYNENRVILTRRLSDDGRSRVAEFAFNPRTQMAQGICCRELLIETLTERFEKHPNPPLDTNVAKRSGWGEPGRYEKNLKLSPRKLERFKWTTHPNITVNHERSLMGRRAIRPDMPTWTDLEPWGNADALWRWIHG